MNSNTDAKNISKSTLLRLPVYLTYLRSLSPDSPSNISSAAIAAALGLGDVQVRKDLASVSNQGKPKIGYQVTELIDDLEEFLGYKDVTDAIVIGAGKLGHALLGYQGFDEYGLNIVAGFDVKIGKEESTERGIPILNMDRLEDFLARTKVRIGIITVPAESAQDICDKLVAGGIMAILNFAPVHLIAPDNVIIQNENIAASLAVLSSRLSASLRKN